MDAAVQRLGLELHGSLLHVLIPVWHAVDSRCPLQTHCVTAVCGLNIQGGGLDVKASVLVAVPGKDTMTPSI